MNRNVPRRLAALIAVLSLCLLPTRARAARPEISARACVLMDAESGTVIYEKEADLRLPIASITKIMTALVALERGETDAPVRVSAGAAATEGSSMGLTAGETCTLRELLYGLLLASGNDAGAAVAEHIAGSGAAFAALMNEKAAELGMENSHFTNPHGLDEAEHYSTARDMALLAAAAMKNPTLRLIASTTEIRLSPGRYYANHNRLLRQCEGCVGLKTGYTSGAGRTLVSVCEREGTTLICVTLNDPDDWADHAALYDWGFENYRTVTVTEPAETLYTLPVISGAKAEAPVAAGAEVRLFLGREDVVSLRESLPHFAYAAVERGERAGSLRVLVNGELRAELPLIYAESVALDGSVPLRFWERVRWAWYLANSADAVRYAHWG